MNRHRFEPARLLLGLLLIGGAAMYVLDSLGEWRVPVWARLAAMPVALTLSAFAAWTTFAVRRHLRRKGRSSPAPEAAPEAAPAAGQALGSMPVDDRRSGYARSEGGEGGEGGGTGGPGHG